MCLPRVPAPQPLSLILILILCLSHFHGWLFLLKFPLCGSASRSLSLILSNLLGPGLMINLLCLTGIQNFATRSAAFAPASREQQGFDKPLGMLQGTQRGASVAGPVRQAPAAFGHLAPHTQRSRPSAATASPARATKEARSRRNTSS